jgi:serine/threonine-protein kinase
VQIGSYEVLRELGRGGAGIVYLARSARGEEVAVKLLSSDSEQSLQRFAREARLLTQLGAGAGFVPLLEAQERFIVMPYLAGGTLRDRLRRGPLGIADTEALGLALARALAEAHARGIVHRDLKPENVLYDQEGSPFVADLGLAKHLSSASTSRSVGLSRSGEVRGTIGYMSPEQLAAARDVDARSDVFALGAILYECLAGRPAFEGATGLELAVAVEKCSPLPLTRVRPDAPASLVAIVERALARSPADRFSDASDLARALARPPERRRPWARTASLVVVAIVAAVAAVVLRRESRAPPSSALPSVPGSLPSDRRAEARRLARKAMSRRDAAVERDLVRQALELDPDCAEAYAARGALAISVGDSESAEKDARIALAKDARCALGLVVLGQAKLLEGDPAGGLALVEQAIALDDRLETSHFARGVILQSQGDFPGALAEFDRAIELDPADGHAFLNRCSVRQEHGGDPAGALADGKRACELLPDAALAWINLGGALARNGDTQGALGAFDRAVQCDSRSAMAYANRAEVRRMLGDLDGSESDANQALDLDPGYPLPLSVRAQVRYQLGRFDEARSDCEAYLRLAPQGSNSGTMRRLLEHFPRLPAR